MTEKEKAKAYDEAIERAKELYDNEIAEEIFPELKEGNTERIRKNCIHFLELQKQHHAATFEIEECIDWLENQGKKSADKIKPRFNVGDWVIFTTSGNLYQIEKKENYEYTLRNIHGGSFCVSFSNEELIREWTIQDAKDGDVLEFEDHGRFVIGILSFVNKTTGKVDVSCLLECNKFKVGVFYNLDTVKPHPATKEQRDSLMKAMNDAGYEWDAEKKELKYDDKN